MIRFLLWLSLLLHNSSANGATRLATHYADALKLACDALPYRTVFHESSCYFVIDAETDSSTASNSCSRVLQGAKLVGEAPDAVWTAVVFSERDFVRDGDSTGKKRAMCFYESRFPGLRNSTTTKSNKCKRNNICAQEKAKLNYLLPLPFIHKFKKPIEPGQTFIIKGESTANSHHWSINFHVKPNAYFKDYYGNHNVALNIAVIHDLARIAISNKVVVHSWINNHWTDYNQNAFPIPNSLKNKAFEIQVRTHETHFQILINNEEFCTYKYQLPLASITHFTIHSDVAYDDLRQFSVQLGADNNAVPTERGITNTGFSFCKTLYVTGMILPHITRPQINFLRNNDGRPVYTQTALHFLPCYDVGKLWMNIHQNSQWGVHQVDNLPFERGVPFNLTITNEARGFEILANGKHHSFFAHRVCPMDITTIWIVEIADLTVEVSHAANCEAPKEKTGICAI